MKRWIFVALVLMGFAELGQGQSNGKPSPATEITEDAAAKFSANTYFVLGATPKQEALLRAQIEAMHPALLPLRIIFVPHWKYLDTTKTFQLHVPTGYTSAMFTHLPSRTVFIDADRILNDNSLGYWMAHELGHLATNSVKESDAERGARELRKRLEDWRTRTAVATHTPAS
jgi:hypothetical protein